MRSGLPCSLTKSVTKLGLEHLVLSTVISPALSTGGTKIVKLVAKERKQWLNID